MPFAAAAAGIRGSNQRLRPVAAATGPSCKVAITNARVFFERLPQSQMGESPEDRVEVLPRIPPLFDREMRTPNAWDIHLEISI
jgi:hypothetical protein